MFISPLFFGHSVNACGLHCCDLNESSQLVYLSLSPTINDNESLLSGIKFEYSQEFVEAIVKKHPFLRKKPKNKLDKKTLSWIEKMGFSETFSPGVRYVFSPFITESNNFGSNVLINTLFPEIYPVFRSRPVFFNEEQLYAVEKEFIKEDYRKIIHHLKESFDLSQENALLVSKKLHKKIFIEKNYIVGDDIKKIGEHRLIIAGYSKPGSDVIFDNRTELHFSNVVQILMDIGIPGNVDIDLKHSYAGFGQVEMDTGKSTAQLKELFIKGEIAQVLGDRVDSYAYKFSKEIYDKYPQFSGSVTAYNGKVIFDYEKGFSRNSLKPQEVIIGEINAVAVINIQNKLVNFDKSGMTVLYNKDDFIHNDI